MIIQIITQPAAWPAQQVPTAKTPHGWEGYQLEPGPAAQAKPFPVTAQQYVAHQLWPVPSGPHAEGWESYELEPGPAAQAKPFPVASQQYVAHQLFQVPNLPRFGWWGWQLDVRFAQPFPAASQQWSSHQPIGEVPPFLPPGSGRRKDVTPFIPDAPRDKRANKPFRPIWDRPRDGAIEKPAPPPAAIFAPLAPPPVDLFAAPPAAQPLSLPTFDHLVPQNAIDIGDMLREAEARSHNLAVLRALGILKE